MKYPVIKGDPGPHLQALDYNYDNTRGWSFTYDFEGLADAIDALAANSVGADGVQARQEGITRRASITYANSEGFNGEQTEPEFDTWELVGNDSEKSLYQHQKCKAFDNTLVAFIRQGVANSTSDGSPTVLANADAQKLYDHLVAGYEGFELSQFVLRRTTTTSRRSTLKAIFTNTHKLFTAAQLQAAELIPAEVLFDIAQVEATAPALATGGALDGIFKYRWLKKTPTVTQQARHKFAKTYEYWFAAWSTWIYEEVT